MTDLARYRSEFPVCEKHIYMNHASVSPLPARTAAAMAGLIDDVSRHGSIHYREWVAAVEGARENAAVLIGASPGEIAITKNTSEGLSFVANGLDWNPGDVVVGIREEFPANFFPWLQLEKTGVNFLQLSLREGRIELDEIDRACRGARALAVSYVQYLSGFRLDLDAVGAICRRHGCLLIVDAVQGLGPFPVDVKRSGVHALSVSAHKWLLGPEGIGFLFLDEEVLPRVRPVEFGWTNVAGFANYSHDVELRPDAGRFECGTMNTAGCFGLRESLGLFLEVGVENMAAHIHGLAARLIEGAGAKGYSPMTARTDDCGSGIVSLRKDGVDAAQAVRLLGEAGVSVSPRAGHVRVAPHFYNTLEEIERVVELLP